MRFHYGRLAPDEVIEHDGIPTTSPGRTLIDLAPLVRTHTLARMLEQAGKQPWKGPSLPALFKRHRGRAGVRRLEAVWGQPIAPTRSDFEAEVLQAVRAAGLPLPEMNQVIEGHEVDAVWHEHHLVAEIDTYGTHGDRYAFERDRERDRILQLAGWKVIRITPANLQRVIAALAGSFRVSRTRRAS